MKPTTDDPAAAAAADAKERRRQAAEARLRGLAKQPGRRETRSLTEQRVDEILNMMCDGVWVSGQTDRQLAELWNLSRERVQQISVAANQLLRRYMREDPDLGKDRLARALQTFERIRQKAENMGTERGLQIALQAEESALTFLGLKPAEKHELSGNAFSNWTDEELNEYVRTGKRPARNPGNVQP